MKALRRCRNNLEVDNVVLIDVDSYNFNNVIVIDVPESHSKKVGGSNGLTNDRSRPLRTYIYIDDDESPSNHHAGTHADSERNFEDDASSSRRYGPDTHFAQENISPVKLSKGKRTYSGISSNNRNSFSLQSDSDSSDDDDSPDCEFMEDFSGKLREQWERASLKRKAGVHNDHIGRRDNSSSFKSSRGAHNDSGVNKNKQKYAQASTSKGKSRQPAYMQGYQHEDRIRHAESSLSDCDARNEVDVDHGKADSRVGNETEDCSQCSPVHRDDKHEHMPSTSSDEENEKNDLDVAPTIGAVPVQSSIIDQREKLKETDEYKRALEEEWSARQIALKIQAEEAQQLRRLQKRKKAETLRLLDMERRQKQRVEEIRESQKKDEENMNLKEVYRTEVRHELNKLEKTCLDMASLLRGLGIQVRAAYKRALLSFHPDRAAGSDMRQQVEAEEKFKLISRMKEKLSL
ncbi:DnaJ domain-containing protein [Cynara cardunculus var. scolymus]|uniref:DnaJ domain-containing protein n=1 Tax=Cynara cardunculus var. scolymus TaxID=59895 RepID=A0A103YBW3_CYNCS|nr:DnaJ domain-containing protein [Cynara cardunculus var. scolymus]